MAGLLATGGCSAELGSSAPGLLGTTCTEFLAADDQTKMNIAAQWANPARDGEMTDQSKFMALGVRASLTQYCNQSGHEDDEIGDLESSFS